MARKPFNNASAPANDNLAPSLDQLLLKAAEFGEVEKMGALIKQGANKNARHTNNDTPLIIAAREGRLEAVRLLLGQNADVTLQNNFQQTALLVSLRDHQDEEIALALIRAKTPPDMQDHWAHAAVHYAAMNNLPKTMTALGHAGANLKLPTRAGMTGLIYATEFQDHHDVIAAMLPFDAGIDMQDHRKMSALMHAVKTGDEKLVASYLALKPNVLLRNADGRSARELAEDHKFTRLVPLLSAAEAQSYGSFGAGLDYEASAPARASFRKKPPVPEIA